MIKEKSNESIWVFVDRVKKEMQPLDQIVVSYKDVDLRIYSDSNSNDISEKYALKVVLNG